MAECKKPDSLLNSDEMDWKRYSFPEILNEHVEQENLSLRKKLGSYESRMADREKILEAVKSELSMATQHIETLQRANTAAFGWAQCREAENQLQKGKLRELYGKLDQMRGKVPSQSGDKGRITELNSGVDPGTGPIITALICVQAMR
jgi:hypothetical protein